MRLALFVHRVLHQGVSCFPGLPHFIIQFLIFGFSLLVLFTAPGVSGFPMEFRVC
jgi:hypothetical protein